MKRFSKVMVLGFLAVFLFAGSALATPIIDFGIIAPTTGSISYAGGISPLVGAGIDVDNVILLDTLNVGPYAITGGMLNFTTGNFVSSTGNSWTFGGGVNSSISIVGGIDINNDSIYEVPLGTTLMAGTFNSATVFYSGGVFKIAGSSFTDWKDSAFLSLFPSFPFSSNYQGNFNISFNAAGTPPGSFSSTEVLSGDVTNAPVPEPATMLLLGSGLLGLASFGRKKFFRKNS